MDKHTRTRHILYRFLLLFAFLFVLGVLSCATVLNTLSLLDSKPDEQVVEVQLVPEECPYELNFRPESVRSRIESIIPEQVEVIRLTEQEQIELWVEEISADNNFDDCIAKAIVYHESRFDADAFSQSQGQSYYGLMQINPRWQKARMEELGVTDLQDPYSNLLVGIDYISDLADSTGDTGYALMLYSMNNAAAKALYKQGKLNSYAKIILSTADIYRSGGDPSGTT